MIRKNVGLLAVAAMLAALASSSRARAREEADGDDDAGRGAIFCHPGEGRAGRPVEDRVVAAFDASAGQNPENLIVGEDGAVYVTLLAARTVARIGPGGERHDVVLPAGEVAGIAIHPHRPELVVAVISADPTVAGLWTVPFAAFRTGASQSPQRSVVLPADGFPNGITYDEEGNLYVADSVLGRIWRVPAHGDNAIPWLDDARLAPTGATFDGITLPGANGIKIALGRVWVSNTSAQQVLSAPLWPDGRPGALSVVFHDVYGLDDFVVTPCGGIVGALNVAGQVVAIAPDGTVRVLQDAATGARNPSAVAFTRDGLFVTNAAYFTAGPSLQRLVF